MSNLFTKIQEKKNMRQIFNSILDPFLNKYGDEIERMYENPDVYKKAFTDTIQMASPRQIQFWKHPEYTIDQFFFATIHDNEGTRSWCIRNETMFDEMDHRPTWIEISPEYLQYNPIQRLTFAYYMYFAFIEGTIFS